MNPCREYVRNHGLPQPDMVGIYGDAPEVPVNLAPIDAALRCLYSRPYMQRVVYGLTPAVEVLR